ncbi:MAG: hypothetical protein JWO86_1327 [Myxococcaceae bacterium]|jgi:hypothetical protein|nr:hypothetical protein [Myxococcaceae bacterium]MEA2747232.1 hypothetical protein [Myxococcales bacterium]
MRLDVESLRGRHPRLAPESAGVLALNVAVALDRRHKPGVVMATEAFGAAVDASLSWQPRPSDASEMLDIDKVTELGAEAIALVLVHEMRGWVARRRLQKGEYADWLLLDQQGQLVALEVSGTDHDDAAARMREKLVQVAKCVAGRTRAACVVRFEGPTTAIKDCPTSLR